MEVMGAWMMSTGKTSQEWGELPESDVRVLHIHHFASLMKQKNLMVRAIREGLARNGDRTPR